MTLYRLNLKLSQELFTIISCFEIALRNAIDNHYTVIHGANWLRDSIRANGFFNTNRCRKTARIIRNKQSNLRPYSHPKLVAEMDFGFWRYLFPQPQFYAAGQSLLQIFAAKPKSTPVVQYNNRYVFNELEKINELRNRIAHHEPVCFKLGGQFIIDTTYAKQNYRLIQDLFSWMLIDESDLLYGIDHVNQIIGKIDDL